MAAGTVCSMLRQPAALPRTFPAAWEPLSTGDHSSPICMTIIPELMEACLP